MYYEDFNSSKNIEDVLNIEKWSSAKQINFGYSNSTYWIKFNINSLIDDKNLEYFLFSENHKIEYLDVFFVNEKNIIFHDRKGFVNPRDHDQLSIRKDVFPIVSNKNNNIDVFIRMKSNFYPVNNNFQVLSKSSLETFIYFDNFIINFCLVLLFVLFIMHILIFKISKIYFYKYYLIYLFFTIIVISFNSGILNLYIFENNVNEVDIIFFKFFGLLMILYLVKVFKYVLDLNLYKKVNKFIDFLIIILFSSVLISDVLTIFDFRIIGLIYLSNISFICILLFILQILISKSIKKCILSYLLILIWLPLFAMMILNLINNFYYLLNEITIEYISKFLFIYESIFISLIIAYKYNLIEKEKEILLLNLKDKEITYLRETKLIRMGEMLNNIAHQWKQPLSRINSIIFKAHDLIDDNQKELLKNQLIKIENETLYMSNTISSLLNFFHINKVKEKFDLIKLAKEQKELFSRLYQIEIVINSLKEKVINSGYKSEYEQVVQVIIENAVESLIISQINNPKIIISILEEDNIIKFSIENNGDLIDENIIEKIFEPYFTTKNKGQHQGIGLYMSKMLIEESMGKILKVSNTEFGVKFTIEG